MSEQAKDEAKTQSEEKASEQATSTSSSPPILSLQELKISFLSRGKWVYAVDGVSMDIFPGQGTAIIGESGSGKTLSMMSTLALISGTPGVFGGDIVYQEGDFSLSLLNGVEKAHRVEGKKAFPNLRTDRWKQAYRKRAKQLAGNRIGIIFQNPIDSLDPFWSVGQTLKESIRLRDPKLPKNEVEKEAINWLERVHIKNPEGVMRSYPHQLSGGMCQRVMIAATLSMRPRIIIADEPTTGLDMTTKAQVLYLLQEAREEYGSSLIFVTHEIGLVTGLAEQVIVMRKGHVVDRFHSSKLADVSIKDGELISEHPFATHTKELLYNSLILEQHHASQQEALAKTF